MYFCRYVRKECISDYQPGPRRFIAEAGDTPDLIAEVFKENSGEWQVELVPKSWITTLLVVDIYKHENVKAQITLHQCLFHDTHGRSKYVWTQLCDS